MSSVEQMERRLEGVFNGAQAEVLAMVIGDAYNELVKTSDFDELKSIVRDLAQARGAPNCAWRSWRRPRGAPNCAWRNWRKPRAHRIAHGGTRASPGTYRLRVEELAQAQVRTEHTVEKLAQGLDELRADFGNLRSDVGTLRLDVENVRSELGGISRTMGYALENEAYRSLPALLEQRHGVRVTDRFVRTEIGGEEINFLAHGVTAEGAAVILVGESKARLDERRGRGAARKRCWRRWRARSPRCRPSTPAPGSCRCW